MTKKRFIVFCAIVAFFSIIPAFAADEKELIFAADPWCPYNCIPGSDAPGYLVELAVTVYQAHGYKVTYISLPWRRALEYAKNGDIHAAIGAVRGNIDGHYIGIKKLGNDETTMIVRKGERFDFTKTSVLDSKKIGVITNYTYDNHGSIDQYLDGRKKKDDNGISILYQVNALHGLFKMILSNRIDVFFENRYVAQYKARKLNISDKIDIVPTGKSDDIFFAFTPNEEGRRLAEILDQGVDQLRSSGKLIIILEKYGIDDWE